jgi:hypothetical protein
MHTSLGMIKIVAMYPILFKGTMSRSIYGYLPHITIAALLLSLTERERLFLP